MTDGLARNRLMANERWLSVLRARELFATVVKARRALDRFPPGHRLRRATLVELTHCARRVLARGPLTVQLVGGELWMGEKHVLGDADGLCLDLARSGVVELTLTADAVPHGVLGLADACASRTTCRARRMRLCGGVLPGVLTRLSA